MLVLLGAGGVALRVYTRHEMQLSPGDTLWRLTYAATFHAKSGAKIRAAIPADTVHGRIFRQDLLYSGLTTERMRPVRSQTREIGLAAMNAGKFSLTAHFDIHLSPRANWRANEPDVNLSADVRAEYLKSTKAIQADSPIVLETLDRLRRDPAAPNDMVRRVFDYCVNEIQLANDSAPSDAAAAIETRSADMLGRAHAMAALCRAAKVPARIVTGFAVAEAAELSPRFWVEVLANGYWEPYDPADGFAGSLPHNFLPVRREGVEIFHGSGVTGLQAKYAAVRLPPSPGTERIGRGQPLEIVDLTRLPLEMHEVLSVILLMPLGALVTAIFRTVIGIRTYGTFTPTLLALSFVYADWRTGLLTFAVVMLLGLTSRTLLDRLKLLMVPRLSVVLTLVALSIIFTVSALDYLNLTPSAQAVLLPMVILTMTVERFYLTAEEDGPAFAMQLLVATILVAFCCYLVLRWDEVGRMLFIYPELHLFTIAVLVLLGRYTGYRLVELWRFRDLIDKGPDTSDDR